MGGLVGLIIVIAILGALLPAVLIWQRTKGALNNKQRRMLMVSGITGQATITSLADTGVTINDNPVVQLGLSVQVPGQPPYAASLRQQISRLMIPSYQPGAVVPVKVSPEDPSVLMIG